MGLGHQVSLLETFVGDIAQLVERTHGMREVTGSTPVISTSLRLSGPSGSASYDWLRQFFIAAASSRCEVGLFIYES